MGKDKGESKGECVAFEPYLFMPLTPEKSEGHIAVGLSVCGSVNVNSDFF